MHPFPNPDAIRSRSARRCSPYAYEEAAAVTVDNKGSKLTVSVKYTGSGTVDESHKIYVVLWDKPDFAMPDAAEMMPLEAKPIHSKTADVSFDVQKSPVYISLVYDPAGKWEAQSAPPVGSSLGLYASKPGVPEPISIEPGKTAKVSVTLDDSFKMTAREKK